MSPSDALMQKQVHSVEFRVIVGGIFSNRRDEWQTEARKRGAKQGR